MIFSSAFAANLAVIHCFIKGQSKDSLLSDSALVISDELNHRSIID
jgi:7-keto-8-aminopelargonate synthetase-like enzyme